jgi:hypothetical protein
MEYWLSEEYEKMFQEALNGKLLSNWKNIYQRTWKDKVDPEDEEAQARMQYVGYRWVAMGMKVTESPWMFETLATSHAKPLKSKIPIPCAVYEQIISESLARMAGYEIEVEQGTIQRLSELEVHVVNDLDWIEMYASHGGCDQDDFFKLFYREFEGGDLDGHKSVIVARSPNGIGEYSIFKYVEGAWHPHWLTSTGEKITFPKVSGRGWVGPRPPPPIAFICVTVLLCSTKHLACSTALHHVQTVFCRVVINMPLCCRAFLVRRFKCVALF